jgi:hypothetical protein
MAITVHRATLVRQVGKRDNNGLEGYSATQVQLKLKAATSEELDLMVHVAAVDGWQPKKKEC